MPIEVNEIAVIRQTEDLYITLSGDGATDLICIGARVREELSTISEMRMEFVSNNTSFDPKSILGKRITLTTKEEFKFSGIVISVEDLGLQKGGDVYAAELRPWLWMTTIGEGNRVYQGKTAPEIVKAVFSSLGFTDVTEKLSATYDTRDYCVQYDESNFDFVSRLMEEEGIYYFFDHSGEVETLVMADGLTAHPDKGDLTFTVANISPTVRADVNTIYEWSEVGKVVSGKVTMWDYDFTLPNSNLLATSTVTSGTHSYKSMERYQSGAHYKTADKGETFFARNLADGHAAEAARAMGLCNTPTLRTGVKFNLKHPERTAVEGSYLVVACTHYLKFDDGPDGTELTRVSRNAERIDYPKQMALFETEFEVMPSGTAFRPLKQVEWPEVPSLLTAIVTGPAGDEIYTDEYGRIKVQFPWDRLGKKDDTSSFWVRSVMPWTGKEWGFLAVPRIGMEVIIQFERGNIDRPICTGMVYNGVNKPPYALPGDMNKLGLRTNSTKGGGGFHELTFDDTKGSESVFFQSEKDYKQLIKNNAEITIGMEKKDEGNLTQTVYNNSTETIKTGDMKLTVETGSRITDIKTDETTTIQGKSTHTITGDTALEVKTGNLTEKVSTGNMSTEVSMGNQDVKISMGNQTTALALGNISVKADVGKIEIEAMQSIELTCGPSSIKIDPMGVTIKGMMISVEGTIQTEVKGLMTTVSGDALLTLKGGITMIN